MSLLEWGDLDGRFKSLCSFVAKQYLPCFFDVRYYIIRHGREIKEELGFDNDKNDCNGYGRYFA